MTLWEPTKCCCCCNVRTGSIIIAVLFLVGGCFSLIGGVQTLFVDNRGFKEACEDTSDPVECEKEFRKLEVGMTIGSMVVACFHIIFSSLLLHGILKKKTAYFVPLMTVYAIQISLMTVVSVAVIILFMYLGLPFVAILFLGVILGLGIFLETYFLLVIRAHYYEIKREKGHVHTALNDHNMEVPPYSGPQVPPYPGPQVPPYPSNEVPPYPGSDALLYPDLEKAPK